MQSNFAASMDEVLREEGGYVDHSKDPGGATNMGITIGTLGDYRGRKVTKSEVKALTKTEAVSIYRQRYARPTGYDALPSGLDHVTLDPAINSGPSRGVKWLQGALGLSGSARDGRMGPQTLGRANGADVPKTIRAACAARLGWLYGLKTWTTFGKGWSRRVARCEAFSLSLAAKSKSAPVGSVVKPALDEAFAKDVANDRAAKSAGATGAGGAGASAYADLSIEVLVVVGLLTAVAIVIFVGQRRHQKNRITELVNIIK